MRYTVVVEGNVEKWYKEGTEELHRENGPAIIRYYESGKVKEKHYYLNDQCHNENGPAAIWYDESGKVRSNVYYLNGYLHNENGPGIIRYHEDGQIEYEQYCFNGMFLTKEEWEKQVKQLKQTCNGKVVEIDGKKYKLVEV